MVFDNGKFCCFMIKIDECLSYTNNHMWAMGAKGKGIDHLIMYQGRMCTWIRKLLSNVCTLSDRIEWMLGMWYVWIIC